MKSKSVILMVVAMACGLAAAYTTAKLTAKSTEENENVLVATSEIKIGTVIKDPEKLFAVAEYKKGTAPGAVTEIEKLKDKIVTRTVRAGNFINIEDLSSNFGINPPKGTKAMAIKVTADAAVGGFIMPGSRVDVMATIVDSRDRPEVITVLQNQEVLAVDKISVRPDGQSAVDTINNVTLAVTPQNAQKLELALRKSGGTVRLLLRDQNDTTITHMSSTRDLNGNAVDFGPGSSDVIVRALAAIQDLPVGQVIDDPAKYFQSVPVAVMPERGYAEPDLAKLKDLTVMVPLFKDSLATMKHFEAPVKGSTNAVVAPAGPIRSMLYIQNLGKEPQMVMYQDGVMLAGEAAPKTAPPPSAPEKTEKTEKTDKAPATKSEK
ncbi:MAG: Flp pilus assembly protein CpaB [Gemmataceae bacterium]